MDEYYPYALEHKSDIIDHLNDFETTLRYSIHHAKKKDIPSLVKTSLEDAKTIDQDLYKTFMIHLRDKPQSHIREQIKDNCKRLLKNLKKAKKDIESHPYPLSERQKDISYMIDHLIECCQKKTKKKDKGMATDKGKRMTLQPCCECICIDIAFIHIMVCFLLFNYTKGCRCIAPISILSLVDSRSYVSRVFVTNIDGEQDEKSFIKSGDSIFAYRM